MWEASSGPNHRQPTQDTVKASLNHKPICQFHVTEKIAHFNCDLVRRLRLKFKIVDLARVNVQSGIARLLERRGKRCAVFGKSAPVH
jgi:hypothetical protein